MIDILQKITEQREARNWSLAHLSFQAGLPLSTVSSWYTGKVTPSVFSLEKICGAFGMSLAQFFSEGNYRALDPIELELLKNWELLSPNQKNAVLELLRSFTETERDTGESFGQAEE